MVRLQALFAGELAPGRRAALRRLRLDYEQRAHSRLAAMFDDGSAAAIVLPRGTVLHDGDVLVGDDGELVLIEARAQPLLAITGAHPQALLRALYHLANRHVPVQIGPARLLIEPDPVLQKMLHGVGVRTEAVMAPFNPEPGAYHDGGHAHAHGGTKARPDDVDGDAGIGEQLSLQAHRGRTPRDGDA